MTTQEKNSKDTSINKLKAAAKKIEKQDIIKQNSKWYNLRPILGYFNWAIFACLIGGREVGKSYSVTNFFVDQ